MSRSIRRWGHSLALRIPKVYADQLQWDDQTEVECEIVDGKLVISPTTPAFTLEELVAGITAENEHDDLWAGPPVGEETW